MKITTVGLDISKSIFHFFAIDQNGKMIKKKVLKRKELLKFLSRIEACTVVMESCGSANYWARKIAELGHEVKLIAPQYIVPYRRKNKNDFNDAEAIAEAAQRANMVFVPIKNIEQQDIQMLIRVRARHIKMQTRLSNQIRGLLAEYGLCMELGKSTLKRKIPEFLEDAENDLTDAARMVFHDLLEEFLQQEIQIKHYDRKIATFTKENEVCKLAQTVIGIGPLTAAAIYAAIGNGSNFQNGRHFSAWCGLVPKQNSTGGKTTLLGISKKGNPYLRELLVHGARTTLQYVDKKTDKLSVWANKLKHEKTYNKACVALANKLARIVWAVITKEQPYQLA